MTTIEEKQHARLSPSASKRWMTCPGSIRLSEEVKSEDKPTKYAAEGTVAHEIGEKCLLEGKEPRDFLGKVFTVDGFKIKVTENMTNAVEEYVNYIIDHITNAEIQSDTNVELQVEVWCSLKHLDIPGLDGGTSDCILINREHRYIEVIDYKHGQGVAVEVEGNTQAMCYGLGAISNMDVELGEWQIINTIVQPRAFHPDGPIRSETLTEDDIFAWQNEKLIPCAEATKDPDAELVPSDEGCRFCPASGSCPALYDKTQEIAMADFAEDKFPDPESLSSEQKQVIMDHATMIKSFIVAVENQIKIDMDHGSKEYKDKYKLVRKTTQRKFVDGVDDDLESPLLDHLDHGDIFTEKLKGIGEIEKALRKKLGKKHAEEIMEEITTKPKGDLVVAPLSDKRVEVQPTLVSDFEDLD